MERLTSLPGRFHYRKWVALYKYDRKYGGSFTPIFHAALAMMVIGMFNDSNTRRKYARANAYNARRDRVTDEIARAWGEERAQNSLNIAELEAATYRARTGRKADDLMMEDGTTFSSKFIGPPSFM